MPAPTSVRTGQRFQVAGTYQADCSKRSQKSFPLHQVAPTCVCCRRSVTWRLLFASKDPAPKAQTSSDESQTEEAQQ